jgi:hypothetical protein
MRVIVLKNYHTHLIIYPFVNFIINKYTVLHEEISFKPNPTCFYSLPI